MQEERTKLWGKKIKWMKMLPTNLGYELCMEEAKL
jgi:hypothetical protein